jgi:hypothetical protein
MDVGNPATTPPVWQPGEAVVLRYITTHDGRPGTTWPCRVVCDGDDLVAQFIPEGTICKNWKPHHSAPDRRLEDDRVPADALWLMFPGRWHSVRVFLQAPDGKRPFRGYYVNFEEPFRRTAIGFDTNDHTLDIVVTPDLSWAWKDRDDFELRVRQGIYSEEFAGEVWAEAVRVIEAIEEHRSPFSDGWDQWRPDPKWDQPMLPSNWESEPVAVWDRRRWAYPSAR